MLFAVAETLLVISASSGIWGNNGRQVFQSVDHVLQGININVLFLFLSILILFNQGLQAKVSVAAIVTSKVGEIRGTGRPRTLMTTLLLLLVLKRGGS